MFQVNTKNNYFFLVILFNILLFQSLLYAESTNLDVKKIIAGTQPLAPSKTRSPQETLFEFIDKTNMATSIIYKIDKEASLDSGLFHSAETLKEASIARELLEKAIETLDLSEIPKSYRKRVALERVLMLKDILDRVVLPKENSVPNVATIDSNRTLHQWNIPNTEISIERNLKKKNINEYLFSADTVRRIPEFFEDIQHLQPLRNKHDIYNSFYDFYSSTPGELLPPKWSVLLPYWSKNNLYWNQTLWQWIFLGITLFLAMLLSIFLFRWKNSKKSIETDFDYTFFDILLPLTILGILFGIDYLFKDVINITSSVFKSISFIIYSLIYIITSWVVYISTNWIAEKFWRSEKLNKNTIDTSVIKTLFRLVSIIASTTVLYFGAQSLGIPIAPLLAGFGALGLAIGIGAQEYFKNVVGGLTLFLDRPVRVGEFCEFNDIIGKIEDIGLRSSKIRTIDKQLVIVSNSVFSTANITNYSRIKSRVLKTTIGVLYDTSEEQLLNIIDKTNSYFDGFSSIKSHRVRLSNLGPYSIDIKVHAEVSIVDISEFLEFQEKFLFKIMQIVKSEGTDFAYPSQTLYLDGDIKK